MPFDNHFLCYFKFRSKIYLAGNNHTFIFTENGEFCSNDPKNVVSLNSDCKQVLCNHASRCRDNMRNCDFIAENIDKDKFKIYSTLYNPNNI